MANNLRKFDTYAEYSAATLVKPAVSLIEETDGVIFDPKPQVPTTGVKLTFNISDTVNETLIYNTGGASEGGEEASEASEAGFTPLFMWVDGDEITPINTYRFTTTGLHTVVLGMDGGTVPEGVFKEIEMVAIEFRNDIETINTEGIASCTALTSVTIGTGITFISTYAFDSCTSLISVTINASTPPDLGGNNEFTNNANGRKIYVPSASVNAYKNDTDWNYYANDIEAIV